MKSKFVTWLIVHFLLVAIFCMLAGRELNVSPWSMFAVYMLIRLAVNKHES